VSKTVAREGIKITKDKFFEILEAYQLWKRFDEVMRKHSSRGVNLHEGITEVIVCYVNDFYHSIGQGSEDAFNKYNEQVQIKATSNFDSDLTSFGPTSEFQHLHFARLNRNGDLLYLYNISIKGLQNIMVNKENTFREQQNQNRRPRFSIIKKIIIPKKLKPYAKVNLINGQITKY